ncbi:hypothetical protein SP15_301 [Bacillus phage SP-15]|uniref:Uncharacterized protein n=1 Tax=Bacillus phage SP-15 TaxID=1792032 RepID=A0A127AWN1_9CAUD|nr:hypothetical protein SP15_301 [Bacillus phage SP-15]AMM45109.1 hypothetical protein SP15_301 [Bacillus phage SP-15]
MSKELTNRKIDGFIAHRFNFYWNVKLVSICPDCGHEADASSTMFRCPACLDNGSRVALNDPGEVWSFRPTTNFSDTRAAMKKLEELSGLVVDLMFRGDRVVAYLKNPDNPEEFWKAIDETPEKAISLAIWEHLRELESKAKSTAGI